MLKKDNSNIEYSSIFKKQEIKNTIVEKTDAQSKTTIEDVDKFFKRENSKLKNIRKNWNF